MKYCPVLILKAFKGFQSPFYVPMNVAIAMERFNYLG